jgi:hypothetical protein
MSASGKGDFNTCTIEDMGNPALEAHLVTQETFAA